MSTLQVMTWNVQNLFAPDPADPAAVSEFDAKISALAAVVDHVDPHVLALQEVGPETVLGPLQEALARPMPYRMAGLPDARGIRVALLSRRVLRDRADVQLFPAGLLPVQVGDDPEGPAGPPTMNQLGRGALHACVRAGNREVHVVVCHLKSKLLTFPGGRFSPLDEDERARFAAYALYRRTSEASTLRSHLDATLHGDGGHLPVILAGDLNDEVEAATTQILNGPPGSEIGTIGFGRPDQGDGDRMWNLAPLLPAGERSTRRHRGRDEIIDHLFVSRHLVERVTAVHTVSPGGGLTSVGDDPVEAAALATGSDHAAVTGAFDLS